MLPRKLAPLRDRQDARTEPWREHGPTAAWLAAILLLLAALFTWLLSGDPGTVRMLPPAPQTRIALTEPLPPPKKIVRPQTRMERTAKPEKATPPRPNAPASPAKTTEQPLSMNTPPVPSDDFNLPQGQHQGFMIGGGNGFGGGHGNGQGGKDGCPNDRNNRYLPSAYPNMISAQVSKVFSGDTSIQQHRFRIKALLWFNAAGQVRRAELAGSSGNLSVDQDIAALLGTVDIATSVPECMQPATVWVSQPWNGKFEDREASATNGTVVWQMPATRR